MKDTLKAKKLQLNKRNMALVVLADALRRKWPVKNTLKTAFHLEFEYVVKYHKRYVWTAHCFTRHNGSDDDIEDLASAIRGKILAQRQDAMVMVKEAHGICWISVVMKNLQTPGLYERPTYLALSDTGKYFFTKQAVAGNIVESVAEILGYQKKKDLKLRGRCVESLLKLLQRKETTDMSSRPVLSRGEALETEYGLDMTEKAAYTDYFNECAGNEDINIGDYTVKLVNSTWLGSQGPALHNKPLRSEIVFSGDVLRIIGNLAATGIATPPFPSYLTDFTALGKNTVKLTKVPDHP